MISWKLWLDDQIHDPYAPARHVPEGFLGAASPQEAIALCLLHGPPVFVDFDHDLGEGLDAKSFCKWMFETFPDNPPAFKVHSANPAGAAWITSYLNSWHRANQLP